MKPEKIGPADAAKLLGMTRRGVLYLIQAGKLPAERLKTFDEGGTSRFFYRLQRDQVEEYREKRDAEEEQGRRPGRPRSEELAATSA